MSWKPKSLGDLLIPSGNTRARGQELPILSITMHEGLVDQTQKFRKRVASRDISSYRVVYANELVVGFPIDEGVLGFQTKYPAAVVSPAYSVWKLRSPQETHIPFIEGYLRSTEARKIYSAKMRGAVARRRSITKEDFLEIEIPFPPLDEQRKISAMLDKAEVLRHLRQESILLSDKLLVSLFHEMFGDPAEQPHSKLVDLLNKPLRNGLSPASAGTYTGTVFTLSAITQGFFNTNSRKVAKFASPPRLASRVDKADFLICRGSGSIKLCGQGQFPSDDGLGIIFPDTIIAASIDFTRVSKSYFAALWNHPYVRKQLEDAARTANGIFKVNQTILENIQIPVPEYILQLQFDSKAKLITSRKPDLVSSAEYSDALFSSLQQRAFRGELDLSRLPVNAQADSPTSSDREDTAERGVLPKGGAFLIAPSGLESELERLATLIRQDGPMPWSADYFKYRVLGTMPARFSFDDLMERVNGVFSEEPPYEEIKDIILELLGQGGEPALLQQRFDLTIDQSTDEVAGSKQIVFEPTS
jgi:type I restriction enzyme S subunit